MKFDHEIFQLHNDMMERNMEGYHAFYLIAQFLTKGGQ